MSNRASPYERRSGRNTHQRRDPHTPSRTPESWLPPPPIRAPPNIMASPTSTTNRNIMVIVDFAELAHLAHPARNDAGEQHYYRMLHPGYYDSCNSFESEALFTHCHLVLARDAHTYTISMLMGALVEHILATFLVEVDPNQIEFRFSDRDGETLQAPRDRRLLELFDDEFPMWRSIQQGVFRNEPIRADIDYPFIARFSCHLSALGVILP